MADALPGAPAPVDLAVPAVSPSSRIPGAAAPLADHLAPAAGRVPTPGELLPLLAGWMSAAGLAADHPWQASIAATLAAHAAAVGQAPAGDDPAEVLCDTIARTASGVLDLIDDQDAMPHRMPLRAAVAQMGWLADELVNRLGGGYIKGGAAVWMLQDYESAALQATGGAA